MTLYLVLIRHAKSSWTDPLQDDHERPLDARGRDAADRIGRWLAATPYQPDIALVSSARRTNESWARISAALPAPVRMRSLAPLYHAAPDTMLRALRSATGAVVAMVGHNPGIAEFAARIVASPPAHPGFARYPTGATLVAGFGAESWAEVHLGTGVVIEFVTPRDLAPA